MNAKLSVVLIIVVLGLGLLLLAPKKQQPVSYQTPIEVVASTTQYTNTQYGFSISLPKSWEGYSIIEDEWEGYSLNSSGQSQIMTENGPLISVRNPDWEYKAPRQDIPVMVFTLKQWNEMQADKFHIGAAPTNPSELGRNTKYVFALPARYNFAYLVGYEEVDDILKANSFKAF